MYIKINRFTIYADETKKIKVEIVYSIRFLYIFLIQFQRVILFLNNKSLSQIYCDGSPENQATGNNHLCSMC